MQLAAKVDEGVGADQDSPASRLETAARTSTAMAKVAAASSLPVNSSPSEHERVRIVFQVLWRSSEAN